VVVVREIQRSVVFCCMWIGMVLATGLPAEARAPRVTASAAVVMDARTGELLWSKNPDQKRAPASTTKILTTVLGLEAERMNDYFRVSKRAQRQQPSKLYLSSGQKVQLRELLYSLMLKSANDSAVVVAEGVDGSVEKFAKRMNKRARKAGARNTHFRNPNGLPNRRHLSTARDMGLILRDALDVDGFRRIAGTTKRKIRVKRGSKTKHIVVRNKNRLLNGYFAKVIGKTGYTRAAGKCFAGAAEWNGREVIVVILGSRDLWGDTRNLVKWAFKGDGRNALPKTRMAKTAPSPANKVVAKSKPAAKKTSPVVIAKAPVKESASKKSEVVRLASVRTSTRPTPRAQASQPGVHQVHHASSSGVVRRGCTGTGCDRWLRYGLSR
jgi:D-alanyl-D-alanine carboxypeptidase (penicillin-binding protein 5/6)